MGSVNVEEMLSLRRLGTLFYLVSPSNSTFEKVEDVPNYTNESNKNENLMESDTSEIEDNADQGIQEEEIVIKPTRRRATRARADWNRLLEEEAIKNINMNTMAQCIKDHEFPPAPPRLDASQGSNPGFLGCVTQLHVTSPLPFLYSIIIMIIIMLTEVSVIWSWHQVHHSHEEYNLTVGLRQSMFQQLCALGFYQPMALLGVPLPAICVHFNLNLLVQFIIHTELIGKCGPLEWIINTPSHHRVHHGANKYCLDKNYGGFLIIWDRLFGTFAAEKDDEEIVYGLVDQPQASSILYLQFFYIRDIIKKARSQETWGNTLRALMYGPGWSPGSPRLGNVDSFKDVKAPRAKYDPYLPLWNKLYIATHFLVTLFLQQVLTFNLKSYTLGTSLMIFGFFLVTLCNISSMYDYWMWAGFVEVARCVCFIVYARTTPVTGHPAVDTFLQICFFVSMMLWTFRTMLFTHDTSKIKFL
ncbi:alkylglycerol monooxygenase-like [Cherax quadricarinatus]|uniref:alkylglycerol monooxygenase-like n=1 Tax=Cherax quadricarinatus TaxID=27406 RepID=UPI00387EB355